MPNINGLKDAENQLITKDNTTNVWLNSIHLRYSFIQLHLPDLTNPHRSFSIYVEKQKHRPVEEVIRRFDKERRLLQI